MTDTSNLIRGSVFYFLRIILVFILQILSNLLILKWLTPNDFGYFATVNIFLGLLQIIFEGGFSVYLIQRKKIADEIEISNFASVQLFFYAVFHLIILLFGLFFYEQFPIIKYLSFIFFAIPFAIIRSLSFSFLEKSLKFNKISIIEILESMIYSTFSILFAYLGFGLWSLIYSILIKSIFGLIISLKYHPLKLKLKYPIINEEIKNAYRFGLNFHSPNILNSLRQLANPIILGLMFSLSLVGYLDRSIYIAGLPLFFVGAVQQKVLFPYYSKFKENTEHLQKMFKSTYYISNIIDKLIYIPLLLTFPYLIQNYLPDWEGITKYSYVFISGNILFGSYFNSLYPILNSSGKSNLIARLAIFTTILTWILLYPLSLVFYDFGLPILSILLWIIGIIPMNKALNSIIHESKVIKEFLNPLISFIPSLFILFYYSDYNTIWSVLIKILISISTYILVLYVLDQNQFKNIIKILKNDT